MPYPAIPSISGGSIDELVDSLERLRKYTEWMLTSLDTQNVKELDADVVNTGTLNANLVTVRSDLGAGYLQIDGTGLRANDGYKNTFEIDYLGNAYFRGNITSEATITGATIRTGAPGTAHLELEAGGFRGVTADGKLSGLVFNPTSTDVVDLFLYHSGAKLVEFYDDYNMYHIRGTSSSSALTLGGYAAPTVASGTWNFTNTTIQGLTTDNPGTHNHGIPDGTVLQTASGGTVTFVASGGHTHNVI